MSHARNKLATFIRQHHIAIIIIAAALTIFLICVWQMRGFYGRDLTNYQVGWWNYIREHGFSGIATISQQTNLGADYPSIWYFFIWLFTATGLYPALPLEVCMKIFASLAVIVSAVFIFGIVRHLKPQAKYLPAVAFAITLFLPSFFLDVAKSNLPDSLYVCFALGATLMALKKRWRTVWFLAGCAICMKFMAIFIIPFLGYLYLRDFRAMTWRQRLAPLYAIVAVTTCAIPGVIAGLNPYDASVLPIITKRTGFLTAYGYTPNIWEFIPHQYGNHFIGIGTTIAFSSVAAIIFFALKFISKARRTAIEFPILFTLLPLIMFYFIPGQREVYFSIAAVCSIIAFVVSARRDLLFVAIGINFTLAMSYLNAFHDGQLFGTSPVTDLHLLTALLGAIIVYLIYQLYKSSKS